MKKVFKTLGIVVGLPLLNIFIMSFLQGVIATTYLISKNLPITEENFLLAAQKLPAEMMSTSMISGVLMLIIISLLCIPSKCSLIKRCQFKKISLKDTVYISMLGFGITVVCLIIVGILIQVFPSYQQVSQQLQHSQNSIIVFFIVVVFAPIFEEIFFRGFIFNHLRKNYNIILSVILQALVFGIAHLNIVQGIYAFVLGIMLALVYMYSKSILGSILVHFICNIFGSVIIPKISINYPMAMIVIIPIGMICLIFAGIKMLKKSEKSLYEVN